VGEDGKGLDDHGVEEAAGRLWLPHSTAYGPSTTNA